MKYIVIAATLLAATLLTPQTFAVLTTSSTGFDLPKVIDFSQFASQQSVNAGIQVGGLISEDVFLTSVGDARVGPMDHGIGANGTWHRSGALSNDSSLGSLTFRFNSGPVRAIGGFMTYCPDCGAGDVLIQALDNGGNVLEGYNLITAAPISTGSSSVDQGGISGIIRPTADIFSFRLSHAFVAVDDVTLSRVPEPSAVLLLAAGSWSLLMVRRRLSAPAHRIPA